MKLPEAVVFLLVTALVVVEDHIHLHGVEPVRLDWIVSLQFSTLNGDLLGFSEIQRTLDKCGGSRLQILPQRR